MENKDFVMEYTTPALLAPKYRYSIVRGTSDTGIEDTTGGSSMCNDSRG